MGTKSRYQFARSSKRQATPNTTKLSSSCLTKKIRRTDSFSRSKLRRKNGSNLIPSTGGICTTAALAVKGDSLTHSLRRSSKFNRKFCMKTKMQATLTSYHTVSIATKKKAFNNDENVMFDMEQQSLFERESTKQNSRLDMQQKPFAWDQFHSGENLVDGKHIDGTKQSSSKRKPVINLQAPSFRTEKSTNQLLEETMNDLNDAQLLSSENASTITISRGRAASLDEMLMFDDQSNGINHGLEFQNAKKVRDQRRLSSSFSSSSAQFQRQRLFQRQQQLESSSMSGRSVSEGSLELLDIGGCVNRFVALSDYDGESLEGGSTSYLSSPTRGLNQHDSSSPWALQPPTFDMNCTLDNRKLDNSPSSGLQTSHTCSLTNLNNAFANTILEEGDEYKSDDEL